jgi:hypothetical protein
MGVPDDGQAAMTGAMIGALIGKSGKVRSGKVSFKCNQLVVASPHDSALSAVMNRRLVAQPAGHTLNLLFYFSTFLLLHLSEAR